MAEVSAASPVAEAAAWLARKGAPVPPEAGASAPGDVAGPVELVEPADHGPARRRRSGHRSGRSSAEEPEKGAGSPPDEPDADPYAVARSIALRKLTAQDRTRHELARALQQRDVPEEVADQVLDRLQEVGLVDDAAFAEAWVESRQQRRHLSRSALRRELRAKGVDRDQIDTALDSVGLGDELIAARELARRRQVTLGDLPYQVRYRRLAGVLGRRGFSSGVVTQVLREVLGQS